MSRYEVPSRDAYFELWSALHLGYDPRAALWPRLWLSLTYYCARPLARRGVAPNLVTGLGAVVSVLVPVLAWRGASGGWWVLLGAVLVVVSGLFDNLDGAVAALTDRVTALGYVLDSMVDRISDGCYLVALWVLGAPAWLCVAGGVVTMLQEYLRARAGNAGLGGELRVVTVAERPTRVIVTALALGAAVAVSADADLAVSVGAAIWVGLGAVGLLELVWATRRALRTD